MSSKIQFTRIVESWGTNCTLKKKNRKYLFDKQGTRGRTILRQQKPNILTWPTPDQSWIITISKILQACIMSGGKVNVNFSFVGSGQSVGGKVGRMDGRGKMLGKKELR